MAVNESPMQSATGRDANSSVRRSEAREVQQTESARSGRTWDASRETNFEELLEWEGRSQCGVCGLSLTFPAGCAWVMCPGCRSVLNLRPQVNPVACGGQMPCSGCGRVQLFPVGTRQVQCNACSTITEIPLPEHINCMGCGTYLAFNAGPAIRLMCTVCGSVMDLEGGMPVVSPVHRVSASEHGPSPTRTHSNRIGRHHDIEEPRSMASPVGATSRLHRRSVCLAPADTLRPDSEKSGSSKREPGAINSTSETLCVATSTRSSAEGPPKDAPFES